MDQYVATVIVAIITGIFTVVTTVVGKRQDKEIDKLTKDTASINKEKEIRQQLLLKEKEREQIMHEVMILVLETNLLILQNTHKDSDNNDELFVKSKDLTKKFYELTESIKDISQDYDLILEIGAEYQKKLEEQQKKKK